QTHNTIFHDFTIQAPPARVFQSISDPKHLVNWWPSKCSGTPKEGEEYNFYFTPEYNWYGEVARYNPDKSFHIRMTRSDPDWDPTSFGFDLTDKNGNTYVSFSHTGWVDCGEHFRVASFCWAML